MGQQALQMRVMRHRIRIIIQASYVKKKEASIVEINHITGACLLALTLAEATR